MLYDILNSDLGPILCVRNEEGLIGVHFLGSDKPKPPREDWQQNSRDPLLKETRRQLTAYLSGKLRDFSLPLAMEGTRFQLTVWKMLTRIPYGATWSYRELADAIGKPTACRAVGQANGKNKLAIIVP